jgi:tetratricopeptide (TPR) repeat protein
LPAENAFSLVLSYVAYLKDKGFYGEAYQAARDVLDMVADALEFRDRANDIASLTLIAGTCARMIGEHSDSIRLLTSALHFVRTGGSRERVADILVSLALAHESLGEKHEAITAAEEAATLTPNNSSDYLQAKSVIAGFIDDGTERVRQLRNLWRRATNQQHFVVADNIAIELANLARDTEEALQHLATVRTARDFAYNYVRATIKRIEALLEAGRQDEVNTHDVADLERSYYLAYSQRLTVLFNQCHKIFWQFLESRADYRGQRSLFTYSSFLWRLNGNLEEEGRYAAKLTAALVSASPTAGEPPDPIMRYCRSRLDKLRPALAPPNTG